MNFDEVMRTFDGKWEDGFALIRGRDGYIWKIAEGTPEKVAKVKQSHTGKFLAEILG